MTTAMDASLSHISPLTNRVTLDSANVYTQSTNDVYFWLPFPYANTPLTQTSRVPYAEIYTLRVKQLVPVAKPITTNFLAHVTLFHANVPQTYVDVVIDTIMNTLLSVGVYSDREQIKQLKVSLGQHAGQAQVAVQLRTLTDEHLCHAT